MQNNTNSLLPNGSILHPGKIRQGNIDLISGALAASLIETIWVFSGYNAEALNRLSIMLNQLYNEGKIREMLDILQILYDVVGMEFPEDVKLLADHPEAQRYLLFSFLLNIDDCMQDFITIYTRR